MKKLLKGVAVVSLLSVMMFNTALASDVKIYEDPTYLDYVETSQIETPISKQTGSVKVAPIEAGGVQSRASGSNNSYKWELIKFGSGEVYATGSSPLIDGMSINFDAYSGGSSVSSQFKQSPSGWKVGAMSCTAKDGAFRITNAVAFFDFRDASYGNYRTSSVTEQWSY